MRMKRIGSLAGTLFLFLVTAASLFAVFFIFMFIFMDALPFFGEGWARIREFFFDSGWYPTSEEAPRFGAFAILFGSAMVTAGAVLFAVLLGIPASVFLSDIVPFRLRQFLKPVIEILAAIPSVAYGFFAMVVFAPFLQDLGMSSGTNAINASIILGIMALPTVVSVSEDSLQAVGRELREGAYACGATRMEVLSRVVIPAAGSGILAAVILGVMRAVGETMVVWMASGNAAQVPEPFFNFLAPVRTLTATIAGEMGETDHTAGSTHYHALFAMAFCLLAFSFVCNLASEWVVRRARKKLKSER